MPARLHPGFAVPCFIRTDYVLRMTQPSSWRETVEIWLELARAISGNGSYHQENGVIIRIEYPDCAFVIKDSHGVVENLSEMSIQ